MFGALFVTSALVMLSPTALAVRPDWHDCTLNGVPWDPDDYLDCPSFGAATRNVEGYFDSEIDVEIDYIYWRYTKPGDATEWQDVDTFEEISFDLKYYFLFYLDIDEGGWEWLILWADGSTDYYGGCEI